MLLVLPKQKFAHEQRGSISVEFAVICFFVILMFLAILEVSRMLYILSAMDLSASETARSTAITEYGNNANFTAIFEQKIAQQAPYWTYLTAEEGLEVTVKECFSIQDIINDNCDSSSFPESKILLFNITYKYQGVFSVWFFSDNNTFSRSFVVLKEYYQQR